MASDTPAAAINAARLALVLYVGHPDWLDDAALVLAGAVTPHIRAEEREACARLAEQESDYCGVPIAELIRARTTP